MLKLIDIKKEYKTSFETVHALKGINLTFRDSEFVSILGPSGCGKTTLLNIIGGLDRYTSGDLIINGTSTKKYKDKDFDAYRNHKIGFVFQNYNLIPHLSVLSNVELSLTLAGEKKEKRRQKALEVLSKVGLKDQVHKKPNQMSGGQMQRVAIARALINDPEIILLDEPTGALDSKTSIEIMELLKEIASDKLVIMVTHNPELAKKYSNRIVNLLDGKVTNDSNPYTKEESLNNDKTTKTSMTFFTALKLSLNNLLTKKGRTLLTAFAGSIGIIGIALILSLSNGVQNYINQVEENTLSSYPITIEKDSVDFASLLSEIMKMGEDDTKEENNKITSNNIMNDMLETMTNDKTKNNLEAFKKYLETNQEITNLASNIQYSYPLAINVYNEDIKGDIVRVNPNEIVSKMGLSQAYEMSSNFTSSSYMTSNDVWEELYDDKDLLHDQFELVKGKFPSKYNEVVLVVDKNEKISDYALYTLGYLDQDELIDNMNKMMNDETVKTSKKFSYDYEDFIGDEFKLVLNTDFYEKENGVWIDKTNNENYIKEMLKSKETIKIVGIIKPKSSTSTVLPYGGIGYTSDLTRHVISENKKAEIIKDQIENKDINIFTGIKFSDSKDFSLSNLNLEAQKYLMSLSEEEKLDFYEKYQKYSEATYESNLETLGYVNLNDPSAINIYAKDFESKEQISDLINDYNNDQKQKGKEENIINYTDIVGLMMSSVKKIINMISYVLIAFVAVSLIVSSIMIGIITYISVLERTKEIGILRSIGASKKDISRVFNAETFIIGLTSGLIGILVTVLISIPSNILVENATDIKNILLLPPIGAIILILISMILTIIAGLIPSKIASKKDPVEALRAE